MSVPPVKESPPKEATESRVVGKSKTGLPWDGEVYEDDASSVKSSATPARTPAKTAAPPSAPRVQATAPAPVPTPTTDDLAREATGTEVGEHASADLRGITRRTNYGDRLRIKKRRERIRRPRSCLFNH